MLPGLLLGLGVALPRYIPVAQENEKEPQSYLAAALASIGFTTATWLLLMSSLKGFFAFLFFGDRHYDYLIPALSLMLIGLSLHSICYAYLRGTLRIANANLLHIVNHGVVPLFAFVVFSRTVSSLLVALGILWILSSILALMAVSLRLPLQLSTADVICHGRQILRYGVGRVPADFLQIAFFALPAIFVAHVRGVQEAGLVAFGASVLTMVGSLYAPIGVILLPKASGMIGQGLLHDLQGHVMLILKFCVTFTVLITIVLEVFTEPIIKAYLGFGEIVSVVRVVRIVMLGALPYAIYVCMRGLIDAFHEKPLNTRNLTVAFAVFVAGSGVGQLTLRDPTYILVAFVLGLLVLGTLTLRDVQKSFSRT